MANQIIDERAVELFDALVANPEGLDIYEIVDALGLGNALSAHQIIRDLRLRLGSLATDKDDRIRGYTIPIRREGRRQIYFLSNLREQGQEWQQVRTDTVMSRLEIDVAYWQSLVFTTDGRGKEGRIARACLRHFTRLLEDVADIRESI